MVQTLYKEGQELEIELPEEDRLEQLHAHVKQFLIGCGVAEVPEQIVIYVTYSDTSITYALVTNVEYLVKLRASINGSHDVIFHVVELSPNSCKLKLAKT
jgi:hypothetical protein